jgi:DNA polymerase-3 subunit epsilon|tara:strand:- start:1062 stop:2459 length:1398 start_codon:yes stop_codon:yes gene_type:complete
VEYAIVDIETTGGYGVKNKITEIAIIIHDGDREIERYSTLVNPKGYIPQNITSLTGITNDMVNGQPEFHEVAKKVWDLTEDRIFVAHNVSFDFNIIKNEFAELGAKFQRKKLCTVRLARKVFPGKPTYSLGKLCEGLGIPLQNRHRALGDTEATVLLFKLILKENGAEELEKELEALNKETKLPPNLNAKAYEALPEKTGIYYFYNTNKEVIYVGKSKNIKKRVTQHFKSGDKSTKASNLLHEIADVTYEVTGSEFVALLKESEEIKTLSPKFNSAQKRIRFNIGIIQYKDQNGYTRLGLDKGSATNIPSYLKFSSKSDAQRFLQKVVNKGVLCQKLVGLQTGKGSCFEKQLGMCRGACVNEETALSYNDRLKKALESFSLSSDSYLIKDEGRDLDEYSVIWVQNGEYQGFGFFNYDVQDPEMIKESIKKVKNNRDVIGIIKAFLVKQNLQIIQLEDSAPSGMLF